VGARGIVSGGIGQHLAGRGNGVAAGQIDGFDELTSRNSRQRRSDTCATPAAQPALLPCHSAFLQNVPMIDWDDLRFVLAVARSGSALRAARALGVNQTTVMRRMERIEAAVGADLFERRQTGYQLTPAGRRIAQGAARIEDEVKALESAAGAERRALSGCVRVTTSEMLANLLIAPWLLTFRREHPGILVELVTDDRLFDLARGEADVALRGSVRKQELPQGAGIVVRRLSRAAWSVYCSRSYADEHGVPTTIEALDGHAIVAVDGPMADLPGPRWLASVARNSRTSARCNSLTNLVVTLKAGLGVATLPCIAGDAVPELVRCLPPVPELEGALWLIVRAEVKSAAHVRAFADSLAAHIKGLRAQLAAEVVDPGAHDRPARPASVPKAEGRATRAFRRRPLAPSR
jgi:DNA-binding transcriptional LysR family regulator